MLLSVIAVLVLLSVVAGDDIEWPDCVNGPLSKNTICDASASHADRAKALVAELTIAEKISLTGNDSPGVPRLGLPSYKWWNEGLVGHP